MEGCAQHLEALCGRGDNVSLERMKQRLQPITRVHSHDYDDNDGLLMRRFEGSGESKNDLFDGSDGDDG